jgi:hypothetical protein
MRVGSTAVPIHEKHSTTSVQVRVRVRTVVAIDLSVCLCPVLSSPLLYMHAARSSRQRRVCIARMWDRSRSGTMTMPGCSYKATTTLGCFPQGEGGAADRGARRAGAGAGRIPLSPGTYGRGSGGVDLAFRCVCTPLATVLFPRPGRPARSASHMHADASGACYRKHARTEARTGAWMVSSRSTKL